MDDEQRKQLWLWHVGPLADLRPMAPDRQRLDFNGMEVIYLRRSKRHYELTFQTSTGAVTLVCSEANGYLRELKCDWFPSRATQEQVEEIQAHMNSI